MPRVSPFDGLVYDPAVAGPLPTVTAPPYDVISDLRRRDYLSASPFSVVHLDLAEGRDEPGDPDSRYVRAAHLLAEWKRRGVLVRTSAPTYYAYEMAFSLGDAERRVRGLFCAVELEDWGGDVLPHERTSPGPVEDRLRLLRATGTHLSAVYGTIAGPCPPLAELLRDVADGPAPFDMFDEQGVRHRMWPVAGDVPVADWVKAEPLMIADGHHRYTTALRYADERRTTDGPGPWDRVLMLVVDAASENPPALPFHRLQLEGDAPGAGEPVPDLAAVLTAVSDEETVVGIAVRDGNEMRFRTVALPGEPPAVRALHEGLLDGRVPEGSLRFVPDAGGAVRAVARAEAVAAYLLPPTTPDRIRAIVERGERLPQKSTYFWPKPRTGMVLMPVDGRSR